jgi:hypothetical protein
VAVAAECLGLAAVVQDPLYLVSHILYQAVAVMTFKLGAAVRAAPYDLVVAVMALIQFLELGQQMAAAAELVMAGITLDTPLMVLMVVQVVDQVKTTA